MPFQVTKFKIRSRFSRTVWAAGVVIALAVASIVVVADGGFYTQSGHGSATTGVQRDPALPRGSCVQCHTSHGQSLRDFGLWTVNDNNLCYTCHSNGVRTYFGQTTYSLSGHSVSSSSMNGRPVGRCVQCHNPHGAGDSGGMFAHLTGSIEEQNCFTCHGTGFKPQGAVDIQTQVNKRYAHRVGDFRRRHDDADESSTVAVDPNVLLSGAMRHVECMDCHNTHYGRHASRPSMSSNIGERLLGTWGLRPTYSGAAWTTPTSYLVERFQDTATKYEYQLCLKCHSNWAWGAAPPYTSDGVLESNIAVEINPSNPAYHNVTGQPAASVPSEDVVSGTADAPGFVGSWGPNSAMACSDCHSQDPSAGSIRGPHGSTYPFMLKKRFKAQAGASDNTGRSGTQSDLCFDCHDWNTYGEGGDGKRTNFRKENDNLHRKSDHARAGCFQCHAAVPHGFKRKHMIVYVSDGFPYYQSDPTNYGAEKGGIEAYAHAQDGSYKKSNCKAGCHHGHQQANPTNPLP
ncbi:MAG: hypothetical protein A2Z18_00285 [Armatimonadetes bacterium RBG_16_58_9]|nr:MAG: hypothetical protein A2Z18_00285 [Armatimonadetes bacterium RBG_16_58_9]